VNVTNTVPMNRRERRAQRVKIAPETVAFTLALDHREEKTAEDGGVYVRVWFRVIAPNGKPLCEQDGDGDAVPVLIASVPQKVRQEVIVRAPALVRV
jgi:hypothetical protein